MVETTRRHERLAERPLPGRRSDVDIGLDHSVSVFIPAGVVPADEPRLLVHFHGPAWLAEDAGASLDPPAVVATVHLGAGSGRYDAAFADPAVFDALLAGVTRRLAEAAGPAGESAVFREVVLSAFSAGHGAVRAILRDPAHFDRVGSVLLLDGLHTGYVPPGTVLDRGGRLDTDRLGSILAFARAALDGRKRLLITHSEIFPGTFASTTETTDYLLRELGLRRTPVLAWGPVGMQQLGEARCGGLIVLAFAGNTAPDHVDHLHALPAMLRAMDDPGATGDADGTTGPAALDGPDVSAAPGGRVGSRDPGPCGRS